MKQTAPKYAVGVIVGRFQVPSLHDGHIELIDHVVDAHDKVIIFLGLAATVGGRENPLDFESRKQMLLEKYPQVSVLYIKDTGNDDSWSDKLDKQIADVCTPAQEQSVCLYGARDSFIEHYTSGRFPTTTLEASHYFSGSEVRGEVSRKSVRGTADFRAGVVWASFNRFPVSYQAVDIAIVKDGKLLLGRKPYEDKFRFPGGFVDVKDASLEAAARREAQEETGVSITDPIYIGSTRVDDWRYRNEQDKILTTLFAATPMFGAVKAADDLAEVRWFDFHAKNPNPGLDSKIMGVHLPVMQMLRATWIEGAKEMGL